MGMSDQYDDGRYDSGRTEPPVGRYYPDGILMPSDPSHDSGYTELAGGWCIPNSQMTGWPFGPRSLPITAVRGGIKYPTPQKETPMTRMTKAQIENELRLNTELMDTLRRSRAFLQEQAKSAIPAEPPSIFTMFTVAVRFKMRGKRYQFLILRAGGTYWTTGKDKNASFPSWEALCAWLEGPDVYDHSPVEILQGAGKVVSFESGRIESESTGQVPF